MIHEHVRANMKLLNIFFFFFSLIETRQNLSLDVNGPIQSGSKE